MTKLPKHLHQIKGHYAVRVVVPPKLREIVFKGDGKIVRTQVGRDFLEFVQAYKVGIMRPL